MNKQSRTKNSIINIIAAVSGQGISILVSFITRICFISKLGEVYLGVNSLFTNIVGLLSLAELGVGTAINYSLYKPLADNDQSTIKSLMQLYKKIYYIIGIAIFIIGVALLPFLNIFMKASETNSVPNLKLIFFLFVLNTSVSYFYSFKRALIISDQKRYIATIYRYGFYIAMNLFQVLILITTQNFIFYLIIMLLCTILENISISIKADKMYPYLKEKNVEKLDNGILSDIKKNTLALLFHKVGSTVVNSTDNILISKIIGIITVGVYSNYLLITNALNVVIAQLFMALTASIGNMGVTESKDKSEIVFYKIFFANFWIDAIISAALYSSVNMLVVTWFGESLVLSKSILALIVINFFIYQIRRTVLTYRDAYGLFWQDRYKALIEALLNIILSIVLGVKMGLSGIFLGTIASTLLVSIWIEPYILFKYGFNSTPRKYYNLLFYYSFITIISCVVCDLIIEIIGLNGLIGFIIGVLICITLVSLLISILFFRTNEFIFIKDMLKKVFGLLRRKKC